MSPATTQRGFTLLEMLVVVVIIGVLVTFGVLSMTGRALEDRLATEAQRLDRILQLATEEAEVKGVNLSLRFGADGYEFLSQNPDGAWVPYEGDAVLRSRQLGDPFVLELYLDGRPVPPATANKNPDQKITPQVYVLASGEVTPFTVALRARGTREFWLEQADALGRFTLQPGVVK